MHRVAVRAKSHRFIVLTFENFNSGGRAQSQTLQKFKELGVFFVDAENFRMLARAQIRQENGSLTAKLCNSSSHRHTVRTGPLVSETLEQQGLHFWRDAMFQAFRFVMGLRPGESDHFGQQHFGELVAKRQALCNLPSFSCQINSPGPFHADVAVARHPLQRRRDRRRRYS